MIIRMHLFLLNGNRELGSAILTEFRTDDILLSAACADSTLCHRLFGKLCAALFANSVAFGSTACWTALPTALPTALLTPRRIALSNRLLIRYPSIFTTQFAQNFTL